MKPNFALNLSHDGIGLLHRNKGGKGGWTLVGEVAIDDADMGAKLAVLRKTAADLEKGGVASKLVIPNSQILYTELEAPGPDDIAREVQIRAGLEGVTPYDVGELVFDWRKGAGKKVVVAVLARETLKEAEQFAKEHRFNPVSFVARPKGKGFKGEAFFGKAAGAATLLGPGGTVEPDDTPVPNLKEAQPGKPEAQEQAEARVKTPAAEDPAPGKPDDAPQEAKDPEAAKSAPVTPETGPTDTKPQAEAPQGPTNVAPAKDKPDAPETSAKPVPPVQKPDAGPAQEPALDEDARVAALLAEVPEPTIPAPVAPQKKTSERSEKPARPKSDGKKMPRQPEPPVLAPFPPTPDDPDEDAAVILPAPPPPPARRKIPANLESKVGIPPKGAKPTGTAPTTARSAKAEPALLDTPVKPKPRPARPEPTPAPAAFQSRRKGAEPDAVKSPGGAGPATSVKPRISLAPDVIAQGANSAPKAPGAAPISAKRPPAPPASPVTSPALAAEDAGDQITGAPQMAGGKASLLSRVTGSATSGAQSIASGAQGLLNRAKSARAKSRTQPVSENTGDEDLSAIIAKPAPGQTTIPVAPPPASAPKTNTETASPPPAASSIASDSEAERLTMFGARKSQTADIGGKPRYLGLVLILILLLVMAVAALSSVFFISDDVSLFRSDDENEFAAAAIPEIETTIEGTASGPGSEPAPPRPTVAKPRPATGEAPAAIDAGTALDDQITADLLNDSEPEPLGDPVVPATEAGNIAETVTPQTPDSIDDEALQAQYAATGIWQEAPAAPSEPQSNRIDDLYVASIDPLTSSHDAVALPPDTSHMQEARPPSPLPPPAAGTLFAFDDRGLVTPTPDGTLSPDGILIFSGRPPVVPIPRPGTAPPPPTISPEELQTLRPRPRPATLVEDNERANFGGATLAELAVRRATARPASLQDEAGAGLDGTPNELALAASPTPGYRPGNFATIVARALENADASDGSVVVAASAAAVSVPSIPTRASVATQATVTNAISLNRINLIGIYGSASERRALVRLSSGRYVKVSVGDRLNGGTVLSITETQLIYKKNGRNVKLDVMPLG